MYRAERRTVRAEDGRAFRTRTVRAQRSDFINPALERQEKTVPLRSEPEVEGDDAIECCGRAVLQELESAVDARREEQGQPDDEVELRFGRGAEVSGQHPCEDDQEVEREDDDRRDDVRAAQLDEKMVEMGLVRMERRAPLEHARGHDAQRVEDGDRKHGEREGYRRVAASVEQVRNPFGLDDTHDEDRHGDAHQQRAAVSDEHLGSSAEDVVQEKGKQRSGRRQSQNAHRARGAVQREDGAENQTRHDAVARRKAVHAVDQIESIDDADAGEDRKRYVFRRRKRMDVPQAAEVVETVMPDEDEQADREDLHDEARRRTQIENVVHRTRVEHDHHGGESHQQRRTVCETVGAGYAEEDAEIDDDASENGDRFFLEFAGVGIVHDLLHLRDLHDARMHEGRGCERNQKRCDDEQTVLHG